MARFLLGVLLGLGIAGMAWMLLDRPLHPPATPEATASRSPAAAASTPAAASLEGRVGARPGSPRLDRAFPKGTAVLRIGDGFVFGEDHVRDGGASGGVDLTCLDLRDSAFFACPHGAEYVLLPVITTREAPPPETTWRFTEDAPSALSKTKLDLGLKASHERSGVGLIQAGEGEAYRVFVRALEKADLALDRFVEIRYARVERREGGGIARTPGSGVGARVAAARERAIIAALTFPSGFQYPIRSPVLSWGAFVAVEALDPKYPLERSQRLVLQGDLPGMLRIPGTVALAIEGDISNGAGIEADGGSLACLVEGDLCGEVTVGTGSVVRVRGDLLGTLKVEGGVSNVLIEGDVFGTLEMEGICAALIRGRVRNLERGFAFQGIHTVYLGGFTGKDSIPSIVDKGGGIYTLHLEDSDLPRKKHESWRRSLAGWSDVIVGDPLWEKMGD